MLYHTIEKRKIRKFFTKGKEEMQKLKKLIVYNLQEAFFFLHSLFVDWGPTQRLSLRLAFHQSVLRQNELEWAKDF